MDFTSVSLSTLISQLPTIMNNNFTATSDYLDVFYDSSNGIIIKPITTTGRIKGTTGEFVNVVVDNLTVKSQFTNWYENYTTVDSTFTTIYNGGDVSTRIATSDTSTNVIWPLEPSAYSWVDVDSPYIKINNDVSYGLQNETTGQELRLLFNTSPSTSNDFSILVDSSEGGQSNLFVTAADAPKTWITLITTAYDASYGPTWIIKEYAGTYTIA